MENLEAKIDQYSEELFIDLGLTAWPEEKKADLYARLQENFHRVILNFLNSRLSHWERERLQQALDEENYHELEKIIKRHPKQKKELKERIEHEFQRLKLTLAKEQNYAKIHQETRTLPQRQTPED